MLVSSKKTKISRPSETNTSYLDWQLHAKYQRGCLEEKAPEQWHCVTEAERAAGTTTAACMKTASTPFHRAAAGRIPSSCAKCPNSRRIRPAAGTLLSLIAMSPERCPRNCLLSHSSNLWYSSSGRTRSTRLAYGDGELSGCGRLGSSGHDEF